MRLFGRSLRGFCFFVVFLTHAVCRICAGIAPYGAVDALPRGLFAYGLLVSGRRGLFLTDAGRAALATGTFAAFAAALRRDLRATLGERAFPRRIRVVRELPTDARGKTTAADVRAALSAWCREPVVADWSATAERLEATLVFPPDCECFQGHFPGFPILPGVAQLYFLRHFARQAFPDFPDAATYRKLKFQRLVRPSEPVALRVTREGEGRFAFSLDVASERAASGVVEPRNGSWFFNTEAQSHKGTEV